MKIAILGDSHFGHGRSNVIAHNYFKKFYEDFFSYLQKNNIKTVIQTGDLFDQRKDVHFYTIKWANENFFTPIKELGIDCYVIAGNHDTTFRNTNELNSVSLLCPPEVTVIDTVPLTHDFDGCLIDFYPWINDSNLEEVKKYATLTKSQFCVGHFEFAGFPLYAGTLAESGMSHKLFGKYEEVFSGHYHTISSKDSVRYVGTPYEMTWSDCNDPKGFWVLDTLTSQTEFVRNPHTLFLKINYVEDMDFDFSEVTQKYIKINVVEKTSQKKFDTFLDNINAVGPHDVKIIEHNFDRVVSGAIENTELVTTHQMITTVIDSLDVTLDKTKLKERVLEFYNEAMALNNSVKSA